MPSRSIVIPLQPDEKQYLEQELNRLSQFQVQVVRQHQLIRGYTDAIMVEKGIDDRLPPSGEYKIAGENLLVIHRPISEPEVPAELPAEAPESLPTPINRAQRRSMAKSKRPPATPPAPPRKSGDGV